MSRIVDWLESSVSSKSELEKELENGSSDNADKKFTFTWGFLIICLGGVWALLELIRAVMYFFK